MITYSQIKNLPHDHPLVQSFIEQQKKLDDAYADNGPIMDIDDEESLDYFDRYVAGDR